MAIVESESMVRARLRRIGIRYTYLAQAFFFASDLLDFPAAPLHDHPAVQLTYHTDFALRVLIYLADRPGEKATTREMAGFYGISLHHLTKVAKSLTRAGWLTATRGAGGGL